MNRLELIKGLQDLEIGCTMGDDGICSHQDSEILDPVIPNCPKVDCSKHSSKRFDKEPVVVISDDIGWSNIDAIKVVDSVIHLIVEEYPIFSDN